MTDRAHDSEQEQFDKLLQEAQSKLREAEQSWYAAFAAAPLGDQRVMAAAVYERLRNATRRPF